MINKIRYLIALNICTRCARREVELLMCINSVQKGTTIYYLMELELAFLGLFYNIGQLIKPDTENEN